MRAGPLRRSYCGLAQQVTGVGESKILRPPSDRVETKPAASTIAELDLNSAERALLEDFFKLLDVWDSEDSGGDTNPS